MDLFASRESAHLPVYFSKYRKDRRAEGSILWFRGGRSRRSKQGQGQVVWQIWPSDGSFPKYLWFMFKERNLSLAALKVYRSAIATIVWPFESDSYGQKIFGSIFLIKTTPKDCKIYLERYSSFRYAQRMVSCSRFRQIQVLFEGYDTSWASDRSLYILMKSYVSVNKFLELHSCFRNEKGSTWTYFTCCGDIQTMFAWIMSNY